MIAEAADQAVTVMPALALLQDPAQQAHMQTLLEEEAEHLQWVYGAALYGTANLQASNSSARGDFEASTGSLFSAPECVQWLQHKAAPRCPPRQH